MLLVPGQVSEEVVIEGKTDIQTQDPTPDQNKDNKCLKPDYLTNKKWRYKLIQNLMNERKECPVEMRDIEISAEVTSSRYNKSKVVPWTLHKRHAREKPWAIELANALSSLLNKSPTTVTRSSLGRFLRTPKIFKTQDPKSNLNY